MIFKTLNTTLRLVTKIYVIRIKIIGIILHKPYLYY